MEHGLDTEAVVVVAACVVLWGLVSSRLGRWSITAPMAFVALGLICTSGLVSLVEGLGRDGIDFVGARLKAPMRQRFDDNRLTDRFGEDHFFPTVARAVEWRSTPSPED